MTVCSNLLISNGKAYFSFASLKEAITISLQDLCFNLKAISDVNGGQSPQKVTATPPSIIPHTLARGHEGKATET